MMMKSSVTFLIGWYISMCIWWLSIFVSGSKNGFSNNLFVLFLSVFMVFGALSVFLQLFKFKNSYKYELRISLYILILGLFLWGFANIIWTFYNFVLKVDVPFPSYADTVFMYSYIAFVIGFIRIVSFDGFKSYLSQINIKKVTNIISVFLSLIPLVVCIWLKIGLTHDTILLKLVLNIFYIFFDLLILSTVISYILFSFFGFNKNTLLSMLNHYVLLLMSFIFLGLADLGFFKYTMLNLYFNGIYIDMLYTTFAFLFAISLFKIISDEYPMTAIEETYINANYVLKFSYLKEFGLNLKKYSGLRVLLVYIISLSISILLFR